MFIAVHVYATPNTNKHTWLYNREEYREDTSIDFELNINTNHYFRRAMEHSSHEKTNWYAYNIHRFIFKNLYSLKAWYHGYRNAASDHSASWVAKWMQGSRGPRGPSRIQSAAGGPHVGPMSFAIRVFIDPVGRACGSTCFSLRRWPKKTGLHLWCKTPMNKKNRKLCTHRSGFYQKDPVLLMLTRHSYTDWQNTS